MVVRFWAVIYSLVHIINITSRYGEGFGGIFIV